MSAGARPGPAPDGFALRAVALPGVPEVRAGHDLGALLVDAVARAGLRLEDDDVLVVASKVVAKAEGRSVRATGRAAAVDAQTVRVVAERSLPGGGTTRVVQSRSGPVLAAAGVDASDVEPGTVLLLPADPDGSARRLRARVAELTGRSPAVVVSDTSGRPWRVGVADVALGVAGMPALDDVRGEADRFGRPLEVTVRAVADEVAALADLVKGKAAGLPAALVRGLGRPLLAAGTPSTSGGGSDGGRPPVVGGVAVGGEDGAGAGACTRTGPSDWFAHGHVEAVRAALGSPPGAVEAPPVDPAADTTAGRLRRAVAVATGPGAPAGATAAVAEEVVVVRGAAVAVGALAERVRLALWAEALAAEVRPGDAAPGDRADAALDVVVTGPGGPAAPEVEVRDAQAPAGPSPS
ncbi:coenzyme F420-0:L-glutamate ligase [Pseudokineococcus lusitanus]|uniref:Coenzyme F420-0:L-glutamate ligase/coenzyme F420-1:gamma-L-glutamate ligase n=1 Tax=Pseudokineococcus lusitanus TaxID=763993 RepID=A0A3N1G933_9ACTN|nr:coenzyme F420-0:L-glutamate ligase [Pseudokineococcus lusitanus]ROP26721.1 coenzyme F420-0:L-glutamate ligase/coenzyme F420-1:gamma-L-glutamate ligase [Pseudokineococcus lusitanus]